MLVFNVSRSTLSLCRPMQLSVSGGRVSVRGACWKRLVSGEAKTVRAIPIESGGLRSRFSGTFSFLCCSLCSLFTNGLSIPVGDGLGRAILGGSALFGVGSLCFYGLGLSGETGAIDRAAYAWHTCTRTQVHFYHHRIVHWLL